MTQFWKFYLGPWFQCPPPPWLCHWIGGILMLVMVTLNIENNNGKPSNYFSTFYQARVGLKMLKIAYSGFLVYKHFQRWGASPLLPPSFLDFLNCTKHSSHWKVPICRSLGNQNILFLVMLNLKINGFPILVCTRSFTPHPPSRPLVYTFV